MKRRKKPRAAARALSDGVIERSGFFGYLQRFLEHSGALGLSASTVLIRERALHGLIRWCAERNLERPQDVTRPVLERYRRHLFHLRKADGNPLSFATQQQNLMAVRALFRWLARENFILSNPASELQLPKVHQRLPRHVLSVDDVERVLAQTAIHGALGLRDRAIIETLYSTGVRRAELTALTLYDVDLKNGTVLVRSGKGGKDRYVPLGLRAARWIERYLDQVRPEIVLEPDPGVLFLHEFGEPFEKQRLGDLVKRYLLAAGIAAPGSCHLFRHAMATHMLEGGCDVRFLQAILGHAQLTTTEIYTHVAIGKLKAVHAATHPAGREPRDDEAPHARDAEAEALLLALAAESDDQRETDAPGPAAA